MIYLDMLEDVADDLSGNGTLWTYEHDSTGGYYIQDGPLPSDVNLYIIKFMTRFY